MQKTLQESLIGLANHLDDKGYLKLADQVDSIVKMAQAIGDKQIVDGVEQVFTPTAEAPTGEWLDSTTEDISFAPTNLDDIVIENDESEGVASTEGAAEGEAEGSATEGGSRRCRTSPPEAVNLVNLWERG